jgi:segregation and condensation protein B
MNEFYIRNVIEAALLAAGKPLQLAEIGQLFDENARPKVDDLRAAIDALAAEYSTRGVEVKETAAGFRIQVRREFASEISRLWPERPARYSRALLETLALIAYRQPITRAEIEAVRGVAVNPNIIKTVIERNWVRVVGHRDVPGRPELLGTTREFLDYFGLRSLDELPPLAELKAMGDYNLQLELPNGASPEGEPKTDGAVVVEAAVEGDGTAPVAGLLTSESAADTDGIPGDTNGAGEVAGDASAEPNGAGEAAQHAFAEADKAGEAAQHALAEADKAGEAAKHASAEADGAGGFAQQVSAETNRGGEAAQHTSGEANGVSEAARHASTELSGAGEFAQAAAGTADRAGEAAQRAFAEANRAGDAAEGNGAEGGEAARHAFAETSGVGESANRAAASEDVSTGAVARANSAGGEVRRCEPNDTAAVQGESADPDSADAAKVHDAIAHHGREPDADLDAEAERTLAAGEGGQRATAESDDAETSGPAGTAISESVDSVDPLDDSADDDADDDELSADGHGSREMVAAPPDLDD